MGKTFQAFILAAGLLATSAGCASCAMGSAPSANVAYEAERGALAASADVPAAAEAPPAIAKAGPSPAAAQPRKVIYSGRFRVVVAEIDRALAAVKALATDCGGYMTRMTASSIVIRVPAEQFEATVEALADVGTVIDKDITAQDVTEEYEDLALRLRNARALREKLEQLLARAKDVKEVLAVEKELARLREQTELLEGRLNRLKNRVAYATLSVTFVKVSGAPAEARPSLPFRWLKTLGVERLLGF